MQAQVETRMLTRMLSHMLTTQRKQENGREGGRQENGRQGGEAEAGQTAAEEPRHTQPRHTTAQARHTPVTPSGLYQEMSQVRQWWVEVGMRGVDGWQMGALKSARSISMAVLCFQTTT
jgi:hypothetical protein